MWNASSLPRLLCALAFLSSRGVLAQESGAPEPPLARALHFLAGEVRSWPAANGCYSCHNSGDGARVLEHARRIGLAVPTQALEDTRRWLSHPERWDAIGDEGPYDDKNLSDLQFARALQEAMHTGDLATGSMAAAAARVAGHQSADGSFEVDANALVGSPVTYGRTLATVLSRRVLCSDRELYSAAIERADEWLREQRPAAVLDCAALLLDWEIRQPGDRGEQWQHCREVLVRGQRDDGGFGPFVRSRPEPFDTAVVLLALAPMHADHDREPDRDEVDPGDSEAWRARLVRGREYLLATQQEDGSWPETTRPAGAESYAQRLSTTAWATEALLVTRSVTAR